MPAPTYPATGGLITPNVMINGVNSILHTFDIGGAFGTTFQIISATVLPFNIAAVGGGGGGGAFDLSFSCGGGGGGAGGVGQTGTPINGVYGQQYLIVVRQGGVGAILAVSSPLNGGDSYVTNPASQYSIYASGGGAGGNSTSTPPLGAFANGQGGDANPTAGALSFQGCGGGGTYDYTGVPAGPGTGHSTGGNPSGAPGFLLPGGGGGFSGDATNASGGVGVNSIIPPNNPICWGGDGGGGQSTSQNFGYGGNGGDINNTTGVSGADGVVFVWYPTPTATTVKLYMEPHQVRTQSGRYDTYKHPGRGLPSYQTEWMDALLFGN